jgi:hypothetical protein
MFTRYASNPASTTPATGDSVGIGVALPSIARRRVTVAELLLGLRSVSGARPKLNVKALGAALVTIKGKPQYRVSPTANGLV